MKHTLQKKRRIYLKKLYMIRYVCTCGYVHTVHFGKNSNMCFLLLYQHNLNSYNTLGLQYYLVQRHYWLFKYKMEFLIKNSKKIYISKTIFAAEKQNCQQQYNSTKHFSDKNIYISVLYVCYISATNSF